jgi:hypothetical protein
MPCCFLSGMGLETHDVYAMGYINPTTHSLSILALIVMALDGHNESWFWHIEVTSGHMSMQILMIEG